MRAKPDRAALAAAHADLAAAFLARRCRGGAQADCVHGGTPKDVRDATLERLGFSNASWDALDVVTACDLISEGLDIPSTGCATDVYTTARPRGIYARIYVDQIPVSPSYSIATAES